MPRFKDKTLERVYQGMIALFNDKDSELYYKGKQHTGAAHRCAFWNGYNETGRLPERNTMVYASYRAGEYCRKNQ